MISTEIRRAEHEDTPQCNRCIFQNVKELNQWISAIRKILPTDTAREKCKKYHRGIYDGDVWNCCKRRLRRGQSNDVLTSHTNDLLQQEIQKINFADGPASSSKDH